MSTLISLTDILPAQHSDHVAPVIEYKVDISYWFITVKQAGEVCLVQCLFNMQLTQHSLLMISTQC